MPPQIRQRHLRVRNSSGTIGGLSYTERNYPAPPPSGPDIPFGVRSSLLGWFAERGLSPTVLWQSLCRREGYGNYNEIEEDIRLRFGDEDANTFADGMRAHFEAERKRMASVAGVDYSAEPALRCIPVPFFLDVIEDGTRRQADSWSGSVPSTIDEVNRLFERRGIFYRMQGMQIQWVADPGLHQGVVKPALEVLSDPRLAGAAAEFSAALAHLRVGSLKDREDAIDEAAKAVESTMKALCDAHGIQRKGNETADPLFKLLDDSGVAVHEADKAVTAVARLRNHYAAHGQGAAVRSIPSGLDALAVRVAANALTYLGGLLP